MWSRISRFPVVAWAAGAAFLVACSDDGPSLISSSTAAGGAAESTSDSGGAAAGGRASSGGASGGGAAAGGGPEGGVAGDGGGSGGGGAPDNGGATDAGTAREGGDADGATSSCVTQGTELCDGFETGQLDPVRWKINKPTGSASITVDRIHAHGGQYAAHVKVVAGQQSTAMIGESVTFPAPSNSFYARMFVYFGPDIPVAANADFHTGFLIGTGKNDRGDVQAGMGMIGSAKQFLGYSIFFGDPKYEFGPWSKTLISPNEWLCVELFENGADPTTEIRQVWVNDVELGDLRSNSAMAAAGQHPNHLPPKFDGAWFGLWEYHPIPTLSDMWIDDVRVSSQKIGCAD